MKNRDFPLEAVRWLASKERLAWHDGRWCTICQPRRPNIHKKGCLHLRAVEYLAELDKQERERKEKQQPGLFGE